MGTQEKKTELVRSLYNTFTQNQLPNDVKIPNRFDKGTGTYFVCTEKTDTELITFESAKKYFEGILAPIKNVSKEDPAYLKSAYCTIAVKAIDEYLKNRH